MPEQLGGLLGPFRPVGIGCVAPEHDAAGGGRGEDVSSSVDAVGQPAGPAGDVELERVDRCRGGVAVRRSRRRTTARPLSARNTTGRLPRGRATSSAPGTATSACAGFAVVEQGPAEARRAGRR